MDYIEHDQPVEAPIVVNRSAVGAQTTSGFAAAVLVLSALPALVAVLGTRDVVQIVAYLGSNEFLPVAGVIATAATFLWRQVQVRRSHREKVMLANDATIGVVK